MIFEPCKILQLIWFSVRGQGHKVTKCKNILVKTVTWRVNSNLDKTVIWRVDIKTVTWRVDVRTVTWIKQ